VLKGETAKPQFKPSGMEGKRDSDTPDDAAGKGKGKRPGSAKRHKTAQLAIHEECAIPPREPLPAGSRFKRYRGAVGHHPAQAVEGVVEVGDEVAVGPGQAGAVAGPVQLIADLPAVGAGRGDRPPGSWLENGTGRAPS
jgi:hypothetical protein